MHRIARNCFVRSCQFCRCPVAQAGRRRRGISCFARPAFRRWTAPRAGGPLTPRKMLAHFSVIKKIICSVNYNSCFPVSPARVICTGGSFASDDGTVKESLRERGGGRAAADGQAHFAYDRMEMHCRAGDAAVSNNPGSPAGAGDGCRQKSEEGVNCASV